MKLNHNKNLLKRMFSKWKQNIKYEVENKKILTPQSLCWADMTDDELPDLDDHLIIN